MTQLRRLAQSVVLACGAAVGLLTGACESDGGTSEFAPVYFAVAQGSVTRAGLPVAGLLLRARVYTAQCPTRSERLTSEQSATTGPDGRYVVRLASSSAVAGQCLVLAAVGTADSVALTLSETPFAVSYGTEPRDSARIDLALP